MIIWPAKDPNEVAKYSWQPTLDTGESISSFVPSVATGDVAIDGNETANGIVTVTLSGGTHGQIATFTLRIVTSGGQTFEQTAFLVVENSSSNLPTLARAKRQCRVDLATEDVLIQGYVNAAIEIVESRTGLAIFSRTVTDEFDCFDEYLEPSLSVSTVSSIDYLDGAGAAQTFNTVRVVHGKVYPNYGLQWPAVGNPAGITLTYTTDSNDKEDLNAAIMLLVGHWYENREAAADRNFTAIEMGVDALLNKHIGKWIA